MDILRLKNLPWIGNPGDRRADAYLLLVLISAFLGYLTVRGWTNICLVLLLIPALMDWRGLSASWKAQGAEGRWLALALASPFVALLLSQVLRHDWLWKAFDAPLRPLLAIVLVLYFFRKRLDFAGLLAYAAPVSLLVLLPVAQTQGYHPNWGTRFHTSFVDTDSFGVFTAVLSSVTLFGLSAQPGAGGWRRGIRVAGLLAGVYLDIRSSTRSSLLALGLMGFIWLVLEGRRVSRKHLLLGLIASAAGLALVPVFLPDIFARFMGGFQEISGWWIGSDSTTSAGMRLGMWKLAWSLFLQHPFMGYGDAGVQAYLNEPWVVAIAKPEVREAIVNGPHNEFLAGLLRSGLAGGLSVLLVFGVPFVLFFRAWHRGGAGYTAGAMGLGFLLTLAICSISFEVMNLKYAATFFGLMVAGLGAQVLWTREAAS